MPRKAIKMEGPHSADIRHKTSEPKIVVVNSTRIFQLGYPKAASIPNPIYKKNLFHNGYPSTLIEVLKQLVWLPEHCF